MAATIDRSTVNSEQYAAPELAKSGFDLSYKRYTSMLLGRLHIVGHQYVMPGDKIYGSSQFNGTFNRIVTPLITPVRAMSYQIYLPFRAIDRTFKKGMTPTKLNGMSASWSVPTVTTKYLVDQLLDAFGLKNSDDPDLQNLNLSILWDDINGSSATDTLSSVLTTEGTTVSNFLYGTTAGSEGIVTLLLYSLTNANGTLRKMAKDLYLEDALLDIAANITAKLGSADSPLNGSLLANEFFNIFLTAVLEPFVGRYSYYGELKYNYLRPFDFYRLSHNLGTDTSTQTYAAFLANLDDTPQSEYALRIMYTIWYERFRNVDLEPVSSTLPDWNDFGSTSIFDMSAGGNLLYLIYRIRSWEKDMFVSAQIDDMSRHVFAPIVSSVDTNASYHIKDVNNHDTGGENSFSNADSQKPATYILSYRDQLTDTDKSISCPVPTNVNDILSAFDLSATDVYGLDLNTLRQSQMLERYLKRNYLFGDEYQDRLLAHYNSRLSDMRINRPEILGQAINDYEASQEVSNVSTDETKVGDRTATATISCAGDNYSTYAEEFGMVLTIMSIMPRPMYDGITPQHLCTKQIDFPIPEFAANNEEFGRKMEIASSGLKSDLNGDAADNHYMFGRYPAYHAWRSRVDEVGGMFLDELQDATFRRFWGMFNDDTTPKLNYFFIHCRPNLNMFASNVLYDSQVYGDVINECFVERVLPTPVETI